jgi:hypothetical protein
MEQQVLGMKNKESKEVYEGLKKLGLAGNGKTNETIKLTKDIRQLYAMYAQGSRFQEPGMKTLKLYAQDHDDEIMDRSILRQNFFLTFQDGSPNSKVTIVPFEF